MFFGACEHQHGTPDRTSGVLIMRNFSKRVDRVTHRKLPSGPVPEQGRRSYSCNLGLNPKITGIATVAAPKCSKTGSICPCVRGHFNLLIKFNCSSRH